MNLRKKIAYAGRHFTPTWRYGFNLKSTMAYLFDHTVANDEAARILSELNQNGIAISSVDKLLPDSSLFAEMCREVEQLELAFADRLAAARVAANQDTESLKTFIFKLLGEVPVLDPQSVYARFALQQEILHIANAYFGMFTQLRYYNVWHTLASQSRARESQLWHRDREDHLILKLFVYFADVDEGAGPFTYAPGTHRKGAIKREPETFVEKGVQRWQDEQMIPIVPENKWIKALGKKGDIVFADTRGCHKGGLARTSDRLLYTCLFTSPTSQVSELFDRSKQFPVPADKSQAFALTRG
ncbi:MAG: phytanoyl-CoA dioxygenase family protein [Acidobacteriota bacterium]|nr:phytanoyl-CoA dioxygenase family protein [Acidobacteriota bacterium]